MAIRIKILRVYDILYRYEIFENILNPTSLQLFLNDLIVSGSSLTNLKHVKIIYFNIRMCCLLEIDGEMTQN